MNQEVREARDTLLISHYLLIPVQFDHLRRELASDAFNMDRVWSKQMFFTKAERCFCPLKAGLEARYAGEIICHKLSVYVYLQYIVRFCIRGFSVIFPTNLEKREINNKCVQQQYTLYSLSP